MFTKIITLDNSIIKNLIQHNEVFSILKQCLIDFSKHNDTVIQPLRSRITLDNPANKFLAMPAYYKEKSLGIKLLTVYPKNKATPSINGMIVLINEKTGETEALLEAEYITGVRTSVISAIATQQMAVEKANVLSIIGTGFQAEHHVHSHIALKSWEIINIIDRSLLRAQTFIDKLIKKHPNQNFKAVSDTKKDALLQSDVICTVTTSKIPVLSYDCLKPHCHINCVGAPFPDETELDNRTMLKAKVFTDSLEAAYNESDLNIRQEFNGDKLNQNFTILSTGLYEMIAGGAAGGGDTGAEGGNGGIAAGVMELKTGQSIYVHIGNLGENVREICGGAGGGGATTVYLEPKKNGVNWKILLVGPGGGGAGMNRRPNEPNEFDLNDESVGDCDKCVAVDKICAQAATGRDISLHTTLASINLTYNPSISGNYTRGCFGGYGGGGQGGPLRDISNKSTSGGGGGGGGYPGGKVGKGENAKACSAGGPGKAYCSMTFCNVTRVNESLNGFFLIKMHQPYKEIPPKDRLNREKPAQNRLSDGSKGHRITFNVLNSFIMLIGYKLSIYI